VLPVSKQVDMDIDDTGQLRVGRGPSEKVPASGYRAIL